MNAIATTTQPSDSSSEMYSKIQDPITAIEKMGEIVEVREVDEPESPAGLPPGGPPVIN